MIKQEAENNIQVFEIMETNSTDKFSKNNKIAALLNKSNNKVNPEIGKRSDYIFSALGVEDKSGHLLHFDINERYLIYH